MKTGNPVRLRPYRIPFIKPFTKLFPNPVKTPIWDEYKEVLKKYEPEVHVHTLERFAYYERAKEAYCVVATGETAQYANIILKKGVVK